MQTPIPQDLHPTDTSISITLKELEEFTQNYNQALNKISEQSLKERIPLLLYISRQLQDFIDSLKDIPESGIESKILSADELSKLFNILFFKDSDLAAVKMPLGEFAMGVAFENNHPKLIDLLLEKHVSLYLDANSSNALAETERAPTNTERQNTPEGNLSGRLIQMMRKILEAYNIFSLYMPFPEYVKAEFEKLKALGKNASDTETINALMTSLEIVQPYLQTIGFGNVLDTIRLNIPDAILETQELPLETATTSTPHYTDDARKVIKNSVIYMTTRGVGFSHPEPEDNKPNETVNIPSERSETSPSIPRAFGGH